MKKIITLTLALIIGASAAFAQQYKNAIGIKMGYDIAFTYKLNLNQKNFVDLGLDLRPWGSFGTTLYGFYNWNWDIAGAPGLSVYAGPGASVGYWASFAITVNGQVGLEYKFQGIPLALSLDFGPGIGFYIGSEHPVGYGGYFGGFGVKYAF